MLRGYLLVMAAALLWALIGPIVKTALAHGMGPVEIGFWRAVYAWVFFAIQAGVGRQIAIKPKYLLGIAAFGLLAVAGLHTFYALAVEAGGAALSAVLLYTAPAWVAVLSWLILKEQMTVIKVGAVILTLVGVFGVSYRPDMGTDGVTIGAIAFGLLSGLSYALFYIFGKAFLYRFKTETVFLYALPIASLGILPFVDFAPFSWKAYLSCMALGGLSSFAANSVYYAGLKHLEATRAAMVATLEPVAAGILAYFLFGELFGTLGFVGSGLILFAVVMTIWDGSRSTREAKKRISHN